MGRVLRGWGPLGPGLTTRAPVVRTGPTTNRSWRCRSRWAPTAVAALTLLAGCGGSAGPTPSPAAPASPSTGSQSAWVRVSVATVWRSPDSPRPVDQPALGYPADIRLWLDRMTLAQRSGLQGRADTQVLLGARVAVLARRSGWAEVRVPDQPTPLAATGYPGWIPLTQLTFSAPRPSAQDATIITETAWLYAKGGSTRLLEVSFGTKLPLLGRSGSWIETELPGGGTALARGEDAVVAAPASAALPAAGDGIVVTARMFTGLPYLWAGSSGFGFDCSGLAYLDYLVHGKVIPRDADAQAHGGSEVARDALRPGDLVFFAADGTVHHVGIYAAPGVMVDSPQTGGAVETVSLANATYAAEYVGARRYLS